MSSEKININDAKLLSPRRNTSAAANIPGLAIEQLVHFGINPNTAYGQTLKGICESLYHTQVDVNELWRITNETIQGLDKVDRIAYFNAKRFLSFQIAKILDTLQNPFRRAYQSLSISQESQTAKGPYPIFDNIPAIFSATPVIVRTATYFYACTEWVDDAFHGKEPTHQIYSRLLNPTSISLANAIVDLECGEYAAEYMAWNFNSGMAAVDALLSNVLKRNDVLILARNIYGGVYQLINDYFAKEDRLNVRVVWFDGFTAEALAPVISEAKRDNSERLRSGAKVHFYMESPCNPHGYVLDVASICAVCHQEDILVMLDSTLATPFLSKPFRRKRKAERPDYLVHSYTKDISGNGAATAGVVIAENARMFTAKGDVSGVIPWHKTMFWDVYYIKGAFLDADKAWEVLSGMRTMEMRILKKAISTKIFARFLSSNSAISVNSHAIPGNENEELRARNLAYGLPSSLFTIDMESAGFSKACFTRFFDALEPMFSQQVSIGQTNSMILAPALTSHSELTKEALKSARIFPTTMRISVGDENPKELCAHFYNAAKMTLDLERPGFSSAFVDIQSLDMLAKKIYLESHEEYINSASSMSAYVS